MTLFGAGIVVVWLLCGVAAAGLCYAWWREDAPFLDAREELGLALLMGLVCGPVALVIIWFVSGFGQHGWRLWETRHAKAKT